MTSPGAARPPAPGWAPSGSGPPPDARSLSTSRVGPGKGARLLIGAILLAPPVLALLWSYVLPTITTVLRSFERDTLRPGRRPGATIPSTGSAESAGVANYEQLFERGIVESFGFALLLGLVPLVFALLVAPALALVAQRAGRRARLLTRALLALPVAAYAPTAVILGWRLHRTDPSSMLDHPRVYLAWIVAATSFGLVVAIGTTLYLGALRSRWTGDSRSPAGAPAGAGTPPGGTPVSVQRAQPSGVWGSVPALLTVGGLLALGVLAAALQTYVAPQLLTGGGPRGDTTTPVLEATRQSLVRMEIGVGSAGSVLLLAVLGVLGLAAVGLLLLTRARIEFDGWHRPARRIAAGPTAPGQATATPAVAGTASAHATGDLAAVERAGVSGPTVVPGGGGQAGLIGGGGGSGAEDGRGGPLARVAVWVALAAFVGIVGWSLAPWLRHSLDGGPLRGQATTASVLVHTWWPPLVGAIVSVTLAAMGGFAIGALRPLGRWSELLLLPFAPWLFVGTGPLAIDGYLRARDLDQINSMVGLIPLGWVSIPALVAFTLLFRGQQEKWQAGGGFARTLLQPALPMLLIAGLLTWLVNAEQLLWPLMIAARPDLMSGPLIAASINGRISLGGEGDTALGLVLPIPILLLFLAAFVTLQITYVDRLAIRVGRSESGTE